MSQRDNFSGGFLLGTVFGSIVGGVLGAVVASRVLNPQSEEPLLSESQTDQRLSSKPKRRSLKASNGQADMEMARRSLEDKIAQLNDAIDDVHQQLGRVNGAEAGARSSVREP
jgi:TolA-binding protein